MLTAKQKIIQNLQGRLGPVNPVIATAGIVDLREGFGALNELVRDGIVEIVNVTLKDNYNASFEAPLYRYKARPSVKLLGI